MFHVPMSTRIRNIRIFYQSLIAFKIGPDFLFNLQTFDGFKVLTFCRVSTWYPQRIANQLLGGKNSEHLHGLGPMSDQLSMSDLENILNISELRLSKPFACNNWHQTIYRQWQYTSNQYDQILPSPDPRNTEGGWRRPMICAADFQMNALSCPCSWLTTTASNDFSCWSPRAVQSNEFKGVQHLHHAAPIRSLLAPLVPTWSCIQWHPQWPRRQNDTCTGGECKGYKVTAP